MRLCSGIFIVASLAFPLHSQQFTEKIDVSIVNVDVTVTRAHVDLYVSIFDQNGANIALCRFSTVANAATGTPTEGELIHNANIQLTNGKPNTIVVAVRDLTTDALGMWRHVVR